MKCLGEQIADRLNELQVPMDILRTKRQRNNFEMWKKGRRIMLVVDGPNDTIVIAYRVCKPIKK